MLLGPGEPGVQPPTRHQPTTEAKRQLLKALSRSEKLKPPLPQEPPAVMLAAAQLPPPPSFLGVYPTRLGQLIREIASSRDEHSGCHTSQPSTQDWASSAGRQTEALKTAACIRHGVLPETPALKRAAQSRPATRLGPARPLPSQAIRSLKASQSWNEQDLQLLSMMQGDEDRERVFPMESKGSAASLDNQSSSSDATLQLSQPFQTDVDYHAGFDEVRGDSALESSSPVDKPDMWIEKALCTHALAETEQPSLHNVPDPVASTLPGGTCTPYLSSKSSSEINPEYPSNQGGCSKPASPRGSSPATHTAPMDLDGPSVLEGVATEPTEGKNAGGTQITSRYLIDSAATADVLASSVLPAEVHNALVLSYYLNCPARVVSHLSRPVTAAPIRRAAYARRQGAPEQGTRASRRQQPKEDSRSAGQLNPTVLGIRPIVTRPPLRPTASEVFDARYDLPLPDCRAPHICFTLLVAALCVCRFVTM